MRLNADKPQDVKEKITGLVLGTVRHNDRFNVVSVYTPTLGRMALLSAAANGRSARIRNAGLMPLSVIETEVNVREGGMSRLTSFSNPEIRHTLSLDPVKNAVSLFLSEFLNRVLRDAPPDIHLWNYVTSSITYFDGLQRDYANFHLFFLYRLLFFLGLSPDTDGYREGMTFDLREARYMAFPPAHNDYLSGEESFLPAFADRLTFNLACRMRLSREGRARILDLLTRYYSIHVPGFGKLKSPDVLRELFD